MEGNMLCFANKMGFIIGVLQILIVIDKFTFRFTKHIDIKPPELHIS